MPRGFVRHGLGHEAGAANGAFILVATAHFFSTLGVGPFLVTQKEERRDVTFHVTVFYLVAGLVGLAIASTLRGHFAVSWESPALPTYFAGMALADLGAEVLRLDRATEAVEESARKAAAKAAEKLHRPQPSPSPSPSPSHKAKTPSPSTK